MALPAAAEPSDFIAAISAYAARSAHALQVFGSEGT
jgi:hypothetical protein